MYNFEITKREVLFSIVIVCVMVILGLVIADSINTALMHKWQDYNTALHIEQNKELFEYGMRTDVGNAFVYGNLCAVDTVSHEEIKGEYAYIERVKEKYTKHTRTYTTTDSKGRTQTHTETYWTWDRVSSEEWHCKQISFLGCAFGYGKIAFPTADYIQTNTYGRTRYKFYGCRTEYTGTLYATLSDSTISNASFHNAMTIDETISSLESGWQLIVFWIAWILLTAGAVFGFYYIDNKWLED